MIWSYYKSQSKTFLYRDYSFNKLNSIYNYNFCGNVKTTCRNEEGLFLRKSVDNCTLLSGHVKNPNLFYLLDKKDYNKGIKVVFNSGDNCKDNEKYSVTWELKCDPEGKTGELNEIDYSDFDDEGKCNYTIRAKSFEGCPKFDFNIIWKFMTDYFYITGSVLIGIGLYFALLGLKSMRITIFVVALLSTTGFIFIITFQFIVPSVQNYLIVWIVLGFSVALGVVIGFVFSYYKKFFYAVFGAVLGFILASFIYILLLRLINIDPNLMYWLTVGIFVVAFSLLTVFFHKYLIIIATSIVGSYSFVRGISLFTGGYPSEFLIIDYIKKGEWEQLAASVTWAFYVFISCFIILSILCIVFQFKTNKDYDKDEEEKRDEMGDELLTKSTMRWRELINLPMFLYTF